MSDAPESITKTTAGGGSPGVAPPAVSSVPTIRRSLPDDDVLHAAEGGRDEVVPGRAGRRPDAARQVLLGRRAGLEGALNRLRRGDEVDVRARPDPGLRAVVRAAGRGLVVEPEHLTTLAPVE